MKPEQEKIFYVAAENYHTALNSPHLEIFNQEGIEVLLLHDRIDEWLVGQLQEFDGKSFQDVAKGELDLGKLDKDEDKKEYGKTVVVDCGGVLSCLRPHALAYRDISVSGNMSEAANAIFGALRWAEAVPNAERVLLADVSSMKGEHRDAVKDRMFRAASATTVNVPIPHVEIGRAHV